MQAKGQVSWQENGQANGVTQEEHTVRASKLDSKHEYDPAKNKWVKVLDKVNREISKLKKELHVLQTFAAQEGKSGPKAVRQTDEAERSELAVKRSKQVRACAGMSCNERETCR